MAQDQVSPNKLQVTGFSLDIQGKVRNTVLPKTKPLLPLFEAVVNSIEAIEELGCSDGEIFIKILREGDQGSLTGDLGFTPIIGFEVIDNGIGFTEDNFKSFFTSDSRHKFSKGSKGIGRFTWLKAFSRVEIDSIYKQNNNFYQRKFEFTTSGVRQDFYQEVQAQEYQNNLTTVKLLTVLHPYSRKIPDDYNIIARYLIEHCLLYFLLDSAPTIKVIDGESFLILNDYLQECTQGSLKKFEFNISDRIFHLETLKFYKAQTSSHLISYTANKREVFSKNISKYILDIPNTKKIKDLEDKPFTYFVCLSGEYLDQKVDSSRTKLYIDDEISELEKEMGEVSIKEINQSVVSFIEKDLAPILEKIRERKETKIRKFVTNEAPSYRVLLKYKPDTVDSISPEINDQELEIELHKKMSDYELSLKKQGQEIVNTPIDYFHKYPDYTQKYHQFLEQYNDLGKHKLATYVVHRKVILQLLENSLQKKDDGKYPLEKDIHELIYPMRTTSDDIEFQQQNLWIIDERLSYHRILASDQKLSQIDDSEIASNDRPDILIFNNPVAFVEGEEQPYSSIVIVEFKRPMRQGYSDQENPFSQVYSYLRDIRSGKFTDKNGILVTLREGTPFYIFIVCDLTAKLKEIAENNGFQETPDSQGFFSFNKNLNAYVEVISFPKLLGDAKKRNKILFDNLHI